MRTRRFVCPMVLALVLPVTLGLGCGLKRDWNICAPEEKQPCLPGYVCTADLHCVRASDGGSDGLVAVDNRGDTGMAGLDGTLFVGSDGPSGATLGPDAGTVDGVPAFPVADAAVGPLPGLDGPEPDRVPVDAPVAAVADAPAADGPLDAPAADGPPDAPVVSGPSDAAAPDVARDAPAADAPDNCDANGACKSKQGQTCQTAADCAGGMPCADGYCCDKACTGSCEACDVGTSPGTCTTLGSNATPHVGHTPCIASDATCAGRCDGTSASCSYPPATTACGTASCLGSSYQAAGTCSNGTCKTPDAQTCTNSCVLSAGGCVACSPGTKQCSPAGVPQLCLSNGTWQDQTGCGTGFSCSAGGCTCTKTTFYRDADGDGYGTVLNPTTACSAPAGYVSNSGDCDDGNASIHPGYATCNVNDRYYCDTDGTFKTQTCSDGCLNGTCRADGTIGLAGWVSCGTNAVRCPTSQGCSAPYGGSGVGSCGIPVNPVYALSCDGPNDCPSGQTCCYDSFQAGSVRTLCNAGTTCPVDPSIPPQHSYTPVCDPLLPQCPYPKTCKLDRGFYSCLE